MGQGGAQNLRRKNEQVRKERGVLYTLQLTSTVAGYGEAPGRPGGFGEVGMGVEWGGEGGPFIGARKEGNRDLKVWIEGSSAVCRDERERGHGEEERKGDVRLAQPVGADMWAPHVSGLKRKKETRARSAAGQASVGLRAREKSWAGPVGLAWLFFLFKRFFFSFPAKQIKQKQNKAKFKQTNFVEFVKINSTTLVTTNRTSRKLILVALIKY